MGKDSYQKLIKSQFGEHEVIESLLNEMGDTTKLCCEFGMSGFSHPNTVQLLQTRGYRGVFFDIRRSTKTNLALEKWGLNGNCENCKITPENINEKVPEDTDVLSIDIDGMEYWVWKALKHAPRIVVIEINRRRKEGVSEYEEDYHFSGGNRKRYSKGEVGCSREAMIDLATKKGYRLVNQLGVNLIFVHESSTTT